MQLDLTSGNIYQKMFRFAVPYLTACFLQSFYGMADLFIAGRFNGAAVVSAVSIGSQVMHFLTVVIVGAAMGTTIMMSHAIGGKDKEAAAKAIGGSVLVFSVIAVLLTAVLILTADGALAMLKTPPEAFRPARDYLRICIFGVPFITAYNVISGIFRGVGDTKSPMFFVALAGIINIGADYILIGLVGMGAAGAAAATVGAQAFSVLFALAAMARRGIGIRMSGKYFRPDRNVIRRILGIGLPISCQEGFIQISFLVITAIANSRGVHVAAAVGIVEKIISFLFLVPGAMLSTVSAMAAQNAGAGFHDRANRTLAGGIRVCVIYGLAVFVIAQLAAEPIVGMFVSGEPEVVLHGGQYFRTYAIDCMIPGIHFCFSGYFSAYGKSVYSFAHNVISIVTVRIPGAWLASVLWPETLYALGGAAPLGSALSVVLCIYFYQKIRKNKTSAAEEQVLQKNL